MRLRELKRKLYCCDYLDLDAALTVLVYCRKKKKKTNKHTFVYRNFKWVKWALLKSTATRSVDIGLTGHSWVPVRLQRGCVFFLSETFRCCLGGGEFPETSCA